MLVMVFLLGAMVGIGTIAVAGVRPLPIAARQARQQDQVQTFTGTVMKSGDSFTLSDSDRQVNDGHSSV
jgi:hypothetical protein